jgi:hypothetical protein
MKPLNTCWCSVIIRRQCGTASSWIWDARLLSDECFRRWYKLQLKFKPKKERQKARSFFTYWWMIWKERNAKKI